MSKESYLERLGEIEAVIPFSKILDRDATNSLNIARYYRMNKLAYDLINSKQGFVHMGISRDGIFKQSDFLEQARTVSQYIDSSKVSSVLELAAGKAATTKHLAKAHPKVRFTGLDLPNGQLNISSIKQKNLRLIEGDYHDLSMFEDNTFDVVYIIEALCHANDKRIVTKEVRRVLKPSGFFIIFDGYVSKDHTSMTETEVLVSNLIYKSMMVTQNGHSYKKLRDILETSNLEIIHEENLSKFVLPTMRRFESGAKKYFKHRAISKIINAFLPIEVTGNAVAAYLMPLSVSNGLHEYWLTVAEKR